MTEERGTYLKLTEKDDKLRDQLVVDAYVQSFTAKTRYPTFLRMLKQVLPQTVQYMTESKFTHYYERLPPAK